MGLDYKNLDGRTRKLMLAEIQRDIAANTLFLSYNLNAQGRIDYPDIIRNAATSGSDVTLAADIISRVKVYEKAGQVKCGKVSEPPGMRSNAHEMLAEGEFNRFYIRAICLRAIEDGISEIVVYRAKNVQHASSESERKIGQRVAAGALLHNLREHPGVDIALGLASGPNSGLSVQLP